jgi:hypothetical protein
MFDSIIQLRGDLTEQHPTIEPKGYKYVRTYASGKLREQNPDCLKYDDFDLFESEPGGEFCYRFWERSVNEIGDGPYLSWNFAVAVAGFMSLEAAIDHALSVYFGDQPEAKPKLTEQQSRALSRVCDLLFEAALRAEQEETQSGHLKRAKETEYSDWVGQLTAENGLIPARDAGALVPKRMHGLYAVYIDDARNMPGVFRTYLTKKGSRLLYVGKAATQTLHTRLVTQDLQHQKPSTFFRGLGAVLGFRPPRSSLRGKKNQNNYTFAPQDTKAIVEWVQTHLSISCLAMSAEDASWHEVFLIDRFRPPFNTAHNKDALPELDALKRECRCIARS